MGFDEFMNIVLFNASYIDSSSNFFKIGKVLIKGDCIITISETNQKNSE